MIQLVLNGLILGFVSTPTCPSNAAGVRWGTRGGFGAALSVGLGAVAGDAAVLVVVLLGLYPLLQAFPSLNALLWLVGALVLGYLAIGMLREAATPPPEVQSPGTEERIAFEVRRPFLTGLAITVLNPSTPLWWVGLLGAWTAAGSSISAALFAAAVLSGTLLWFGALAVLLHFGRARLTARATRAILVASALVLLGYAAWLAVQAAGTI